jgi:hypothetical protein
VYISLEACCACIFQENVLVLLRSATNVVACSVSLILVTEVAHCIGYLRVRVRVRVTLQLTVGQSVCLGVEPNLGLLTRDIIFYFFESYSLVLFGAPSLISKLYIYIYIYIAAISPTSSYSLSTDRTENVSSITECSLLSSIQHIPELFPSSGCCNVARLHSCYLAMVVSVPPQSFIWANMPHYIFNYCLPMGFWPWSILYHWNSAAVRIILHEEIGISMLHLQSRRLGLEGF